MLFVFSYLSLLFIFNNHAVYKLSSFTMLMVKGTRWYTRTYQYMLECYASPVNIFAQYNQNPISMTIKHSLVVCWSSKVGTLPPCWDSLTWVGDLRGCSHQPIQTPSIGMSGCNNVKSGGPHLYLNIIPTNFIAGNGRKFWCDRGMRLGTPCEVVLKRKTPTSWGSLVTMFHHALHAYPSISIAVSGRIWA